MEKIHFSITINAPREKVWSTMLDDATYRQWTTPFSEGSYYEGGWNEGDKILFLGPDPVTGKTGGMVARIKENRKPEFISIEHVGLMQEGVEITEGPLVEAWTPAFENYTFIEKDGATEVQVDVDVNEAMKAEFEQMWPKALEKLKEIAER
jgi:uncharacterized protein YndB with AHSA1/START domain